MPIITYRQGGTADPEVFNFEFNSLLYPECVAIEKLTGRNYMTEVPAACMGGNVEVIGAILFVMLKRSEPTLKADQVLDTLAPGRDIDIDITPTEAEQILEGLTQLPPDQITPEIRQAIDVMAEKVAANGGPSDEDPEDPKA